MCIDLFGVSCQVSQLAMALFFWIIVPISFFCIAAKLDEM